MHYIRYFIQYEHVIHGDGFGPSQRPFLEHVDCGSVYHEYFYAVDIHDGRVGKANGLPYFCWWIWIIAAFQAYEHFFPWNVFGDVPLYMFPVPGRVDYEDKI